MVTLSNCVGYQSYIQNFVVPCNEEVGAVQTHLPVLTIADMQVVMTCRS